MVTVRMEIHRYLAAKMYGFLRSEDGREAFFHLASFDAGPWGEEPPPPISGEEVEVRIDFDSSSGKKAPRALRVTRCNPPQLLRGKVEKFYTVRGYGFIQCGEESYFLHRSEVMENRVPQPDDVVEFYPGLRDGNPRACYVRILKRGS